MTAVEEATEDALVEGASPVVPWGDFHPWFRKSWRQGEHMTFIGPTGVGKTTLALEVLDVRRFVAAAGVKPRDDTMDQLIRDYGYRRYETFNGEVDDKLVVWPTFHGTADHRYQADVFGHMIDTVMRQGGWTIFLDEVNYMSDMLRLERHLKMLLNTARSGRITVVAGTQRPRFIPLAFYDQATHLFVWRDNDEENVKRLAQLFGNDRRVVQAEIANLQKREVLYANRVTGFRCRTTVEVA